MPGRTVATWCAARSSSFSFAYSPIVISTASTPSRSSPSRRSAARHPLVSPSFFLSSSRCRPLICHCVSSRGSSLCAQRCNPSTAFVRGFPTSSWASDLTAACRRRSRSWHSAVPRKMARFQARVAHGLIGALPCPMPGLTTPKTVTTTDLAPTPSDWLSSFRSPCFCLPFIYCRLAYCCLRASLLWSLVFVTRLVSGWASTLPAGFQLSAAAGARFRSVVLARTQYFPFPRATSINASSTI
jgi:hypothetical protein